MMNRFICIPLCLFLLSVCNPKKNERPNGWYYITDRVEDSISLEPIVTINDFEEIKWIYPHPDSDPHSRGYKNLIFKYKITIKLQYLGGGIKN